MLYHRNGFQVKSFYCSLWVTCFLIFLRAAKGLPSSNIGTICYVQGCTCVVNSQRLISVLCSRFNNQETLIDANSMPNDVLEFVVVDSTGRLVFEAGSFSKLHSLQRVSVRNVANVTVQRHAFLNLSSAHLIFSAWDCTQVNIESRAFFLTRGPVSVVIIQSGSVLIGAAAFSWLLSLNLAQISELKLAEHAFSQDSQRISKTGPTTKVALSNVTIAQLSSKSFSSSMLEINIVNSEVGTVRKDAFCGLDLYRVLIEGSVIRVLQTGAFSDRSLVQRLRIKYVRIETVEPGAFLSAVNNFSLTESTIQTVRKGGLNMSAVVSVRCANNTFGYVEERALTFRNWNGVTMENNTFRKLETEAISLVTSQDDTSFSPSSNYFSFSGNVIGDIDPNSLAVFFPAAEQYDETKYLVSEGNIFIKNCQCDFRHWLERVTLANDFLVNVLYNNSYCSLSSSLASCYERVAGFIPIVEFVAFACQSNTSVPCTRRESTQLEKVGTEGTVTTSTKRNPNIDKAIIMLNGGTIGERCSKNEKTVIGSLFAVAVGGMLVTLVASGAMWLNRQSDRVKQLKLSILPSAGILFAFFSRTFSSSSSSSDRMARSTSAHSITRIPVHEYAELHIQKESPSSVHCSSVSKNMRVCNEPQMDSDGDIVTIVYEDKATQTLPEELTHELLQSLREKLDDPDPQNYGEARTMIEHLYDLIKVEENCNNNALNEIDIMEELEEDVLTDNVYQVIGQPLCPLKREVEILLKDRDSYRKMLVHSCTKAPSLEKLLPLRLSLRNSVMLATEYAEPADKAPVYEYAEVISDILHQNERPEAEGLPFREKGKASNLPEKEVEADDPVRKLKLSESVSDFASTLLTQYSDNLAKSFGKKTAASLSTRPLPLTPDSYPSTDDLCKPAIAPLAVDL